MLLVLSSVAVGILLFLSFLYPPAVAFVYALTCDTNDSWGVSSYLRTVGFESLVQWARGPLLVAAVMSFVKIWKDRKRRSIGTRVWLVASVLGACQLWILLGEALKGEPYQSLPSYVVYTGLPAGLVTLAYCRERSARILFVLALTIQLCLSVIMLVFPLGPLAVLNGRNYPMLDTGLLGTQDWYEGGLARIGDQHRVFAQHYNPQAYGLYALVGIVVGGYLLLTAKRKILQVVGVLLLSVGCFGWSVTVPRGATAGLLVGIGVVVWRSLKPRRFSAAGVLTMAVVTIACAVALVTLPIPWADVVPAFAITGDDLTVRVEATQRAMRQIAEFPWFGVPAAVFNADKVSIHQIMGYFAVMFGLPAGAACTWLLLISVWASRGPAGRWIARDRPAKSSGDISAGEINMSSLLMGALLGMGLTNNFGASMLYWSTWAISCLPWTLNGRDPGGAISRERAAHWIALDQSRDVSSRPTVPHAIDKLGGIIVESPQMKS